jgi:hypothetical protein
MGSEVKACRDEQKVAIIVPGMPNNIFRLTIPPNSLKDWRAYLVKFQNVQFDISDVVTRLTILPEGKKLKFSPSPSPWLDDTTLGVRDKALAAKASDMIVGRLDRPRQGVLAAPAQEQPRPLPAPIEHVQHAAFPSTGTAPPSTTSAQTGQHVPSASPSEARPPQRRRRRTAAEMQAANAGGAPPQQPAMAPFRVQQVQPNGPAGPAFGVATGVAPNPELQGAIDSIFGS